MKIVHSFLLAAVLALGVSVAVAQDEQKPAPSTPAAPPAPDSANPPPPPPPGSQNETPPPLPPGHEGRHHGSSRSPEDGRPEGWHRPGWPMPAQVPSKPTPYIGVITSTPPGVLSAQLSLPEGFGLVVSDVLPDSPAAKAGVQRYDVLTKFNDQQLVDSGQFSTLVRALKKGDQANLTLIRKTQEQKVSVTIDERLLPEHRPFPFPGGFPGSHMHGDIDKSGGPFPEGGRSYGDRARMYQEHMRAVESNEPAGSPGPSADGAPPIPPEDILREVRPGGVAQIRLLRPDSAVTYNMANARLVMKDDTGEIEMTTHDGKRSLVAKNAKGETIFDGAIDTEEQRKALPEDVRKKLEMIEVQRKLAETPQSSVDSALLPEVQ